MEGGDDLLTFSLRLPIISKIIKSLDLKVKSLTSILSACVAQTPFIIASINSTSQSSEDVIG